MAEGQKIGAAIGFARSDDVRHRIEDGVLTVTVDRAAKRNPLSLGVLDRIREIFTDAACTRSRPSGSPTA